MNKKVVIRRVIILFVSTVGIVFGCLYSANAYDSFNPYTPMTNEWQMQQNNNSLHNLLESQQRQQQIINNASSYSKEYNDEQKKHYNEKVTTFCSPQGFDKAKCDKYCKNLKDYDGKNELCGTPAAKVKKNIVAKVAPLQQEKDVWKTKRQEILSGLKQAKVDLIKNFKEKFTTEKCAVVNARVQEKTTAFDTTGAKHTQVYINLISRIAKFISNFDAAKLDTTTIKSHEEELKTKINKFKEDYSAYIAKLKETKTLTCGHSEGEFKGTLLEAKTLLQTVHDDAADIRTYTRETILVDIKALKEQMPKEQAQTDGTDANNQ